MEKNILVSYASKYGSTQEIARKMGDVLFREGLQADVFPIDDIQNLSSYSAVILGSAIYVGSWPKEAAAFLKVHEKDLADRPVWLFSSGPTGEGDPVELVNGKRLPAALQPIVDRIQPRDIAVFHGNIDPDRINFMEKMAIKNLVKKPFGDFRDWDMVISWTTSIAEALKKTEHF